MYPKVFQNQLVKNNPRVSPVLGAYYQHKTQIQPTWPSENFQFYKDDPLVKSVDAFLCGFPPSRCQVWREFNKSTIFIAAHRYNLGRCSIHEWTDLNGYLKDMSPSKGDFIGALSKYDQEYMRFYTGLQPALFPSYSGNYMDISLYDKYLNNKSQEIVIFSHNGQFIMNVKAGLEPQVLLKTYSHFEPEDLARHKAAIMMPHSVMSYMTTELYALGMPLFVPSMKYWKNVGGLGYDRTVVGAPYDCDPKEVAKFEKIHSERIEKRVHPYSPNVDFAVDPEAELYWLQMADFFHWPHVQYFDNIPDLKQKLLHTDFERVHNSMKQEMQVKKSKLKMELCDIVFVNDKVRLNSQNKNT